MRIASVKATPLEASFGRHFGGPDRVPAHISRPASHFQAIPRTGQYSTLVEICDEDGRIGYGEAFGLPHPGAATALLRDVIAPALTGASLDAPDETLSVLTRYFLALGQAQGIAAEAMSAVDIALWDLVAKARNVSLAEALGARPGPVQTYVSPVAFHGTPEESAEAARSFIGEGFRAVKIKIGRGVKLDVLHVSAVRKSIGDDVKLMLDANCAYDPETAIVLSHQLEPLRVEWIEEPIPPGDAAAMAAVRKQSPIPIAAGENLFALSEFTALAQADAVDILQPNITRAGGVSGVVAIDRMCTEYGISLALHGVGGCVGVAAALHAIPACKSATLYEANRLPNALRDLLPMHKPILSDGTLFPPPGPGHGGEPDPELVQSYRLEEIRTRPSDG